MFTFKLIRSSIASARLNQRNICANSGRLLSVFGDKEKQDEPREELTFDVNDLEEEDVEEKQRRIEMIRNKSGLLPQHRNMLHGIAPYEESQSWVHETLKYKRKMYAKYGSESKLDPSKF